MVLNCYRSFQFFLIPRPKYGKKPYRLATAVWTRWYGVGKDGLMINGKSADYMGVTGALKYRVQLKAVPEGGTMKLDDADMIIEKADAVTLYIVAATNFVNYKDVSADQNAGPILVWLPSVTLLPALPKEWNDGQFNGVCARGAFELDMVWKDGKITSVSVLSKEGQVCRIRTGFKGKISTGGKALRCRILPDGTMEFPTVKGGRYVIKA